MEGRIEKRERERNRGKGYEKKRRAVIKED